jgi:long-chain fatty acid transport protein
MRRMLLGCSVFFCAELIWAVGSGGFTNQVVGTKALGMGNAFSAVADDPSAIFFNPAGIAQLDGVQISLGVSPIFPKSTYSSPTNDSQMSSYAPVSPHFHSTWRSSSERWAAGMGVYSSFGLKTVWPDNGPLRYTTTDSSLVISQYSPVIAFRVFDFLYVGGGPVIVTGKVSLKSRIDTDSLNQVFGGVPDSTTQDGEKSLVGSGDGLGANIGILFKPVVHHSLGITYRSDTKINLRGDTTLTGLSKESASIFGGSDYSTPTESSITLPPSITLGYAYSLKRLTVSLDGEWVGYSSYRKTHLTFVNEKDPFRSAVLNTNNPTSNYYKDSWSVGTGANYQWNKHWESRCGYFFFPAVVGESVWTPRVPDSNTHGFNLGGGWGNSSLTMNLSYSYLLYEPRTISNTVDGGSVNGKYETSAQIVSVGVNLRFFGKTRNN